MCKLISAIIFTILFWGSFQAQNKSSYKIFKAGNDFKAYGLFAGAGMIKPIQSQPYFFTQDISSTTSYEIEVKGYGKYAPAIEVGGFSVFKYGPIRMIDFGFSYRKVKGGETADAVLLPGADLSYPDQLHGEGTFIHHRTAFRMNFNVAIPLGKKSFLHMGPGLSARLTIKKKEQYYKRHIDIRTDSDVSGTSAGLNYLLGIGWKVAPGKFLDFYTYMPIMNFERSGFDGREPLFNTEYHLLTVGLRLLWLKPSQDRSCPDHSGARFSNTRNSGRNQPW